MPVIKSAIKKLKQDRKREKENNSLRQRVEQAVRNAKKGPSQKTISLAFSVIDKAVKNKLLHKNKASRMKSALSKLPGVKKTPAIKTVSKKVAPKITSKIAPKKRKTASA